MSIEQKWNEIHKRIYFSYIVIAVIGFMLYVYIFYKWLSLEYIGNYVFVLLLLSFIPILIDEYKKEQGDLDRKSILYCFPVMSLWVLLTVYGIMKNILLLPPFFLIYLYLLLPLFIAYKREENPKSKMLAIAKIIFFMTLFFILLYLVHIYGVE